MDRLRDPASATIAAMMTILLMIAIACFTFGGLLWSGQHYAWANLLFGLGALAPIIALLLVLLLFGPWTWQAKPSGPAGSRGTLTALKKPGPSSPEVPVLQFQTQDDESTRELAVGGKPQVIRIISPVDETVRERDLPFSFKCGKGKVIIKRFTDQGIAIEEQGTYEDTVKIELYRVSQTIPIGVAKMRTVAPALTVLVGVPTPWQRAKNIWGRISQWVRNLGR